MTRWCLTREEYLALERDGQIRRPLTWGATRRRDKTTDLPAAVTDLTLLVESFVGES